VFGYMYNSEIQQALRNRKGIGEMIKTAPFDEIIEDIDTKIEEETEPAVAPDPAGEEDPFAAELYGNASFEINVELKKMEEQMDEDQISKLEKYKCMARNLVNSNVDLFPETLPTEELVQKLQDSAAGKAVNAAESKSFTAIVYDPRCAGISSSNPTSRVPSLRTNGEHLRGLAKLIFRARGDAIKDNDMWLLFDAGRSGRLLLTPLPPPPISPSTPPPPPSSSFSYSSSLLLVLLLAPPPPTPSSSCSSSEDLMRKRYRRHEEEEEKEEKSFFAR